jgi:hypothetical protein
MERIIRRARFRQLKAILVQEICIDRQTANKLPATIAVARVTDSNVKRIIICNSGIDLVKLDDGSLVELAYPICFAIAGHHLPRT